MTWRGRSGVVRATARVSAALAAAALMSACQEARHPLLGEWVSVGTAVPAMTYVFEDNGRSLWILDLPQGPDTFSVSYRVDYDPSPAHLDVGPWSTGPVTGRTLFGIMEMLAPDRFRVDFEPADPDTGAPERPTEFSDQTVTFVRKLN